MEVFEVDDFINYSDDISKMGIDKELSASLSEYTNRILKERLPFHYVYSDKHDGGITPYDTERNDNHTHKRYYFFEELEPEVKKCTHYMSKILSEFTKAKYCSDCGAEL